MIYLLIGFCMVVFLMLALTPFFVEMNEEVPNESR